MAIPLFRDYKAGNILHHSTFGGMDYQVFKVISNNDDVLEIINAKSGKVVRIEREDDQYVKAIELTPEIFEKLGFKVYDNPIEKSRKWRNDFLELISTGENVVSGMEIRNTFDGYRVRDIKKDEELILLDDDDRYVDYVHELQNIYSHSFSKTLDVTSLLDIPR